MLKRTLSRTVPVELSEVQFHYERTVRNGELILQSAVRPSLRLIQRRCAGIGNCGVGHVAVLALSAIHTLPLGSVNCGPPQRIRMGVKDVPDDPPKNRPLTTA